MSETTHSLIEDVARMLEGHGLKNTAGALRLARHEIPDVPVVDSDEIARLRAELTEQLRLMTEARDYEKEAHARTRAYYESRTPSSAALGKPVAWRYRYSGLEEWKYVDTENECNPHDCYERQPLYGAPSATSFPSAAALANATSAVYDPATGKCSGDCDCRIGETCKAYLVYHAKQNAADSRGNDGRD